MTTTTETIDRKGGKRRYTDEGFLVVPARIARTGVQHYRAYELGVTDGDPMRVVRVYRSADEVFDPDAMASFENKPVTNDHPTVSVDSTNWKQLAVGFARNVKREGDYLTADLVVTDKDAIDMIVGGKVELSNGYTTDYDWTPGTAPDGQAYDAQQKNIRGNHVAIVDAARCGPACRVSDTTPPNQPKGNKMADRKVTIDGIPFELPEAAAAAVEKLIADRAAAQAASTQAGADMAAQKTANDAALQAKDAEIAALKKDVMTPEQRDAMVESWTKLIADAKRLVPDYDTKGKTCDAIRRDIITAAAKDEKRKPIVDAALAGRTLDALDATATKMVFSILAAMPAGQQATNDAAVSDALRQAAGDTTAANEAPAGRAALHARFQSLSAGPAA